MNVYKGLLFLHGHLIHAEDLEDATSAEPTHAPAATAPAANRVAAAADTPSRLRTGFSLIESLLFLGGRPMHPDRPLDREEPFEQLIDACTARVGNIGKHGRE
jgi:hypothetical protein